MPTSPDAKRARVEEVMVSPSKPSMPGALGLTPVQSELGTTSPCNKRTESEDTLMDIVEVMDAPSCQEVAQQQETRIQFHSSLNMYSMARGVRLSGIVCTIGPASREPATLLQLIESGMNIARMNFSHGTHEYHAKTIANCRLASDMYREKHGTNVNLAIALDTKGPEIRTGLLLGDDGRKEIRLTSGSTIKITTEEQFKEACTEEVVWVDYQHITNVMEVGKKLFIDDGLISVRCTEVCEGFFLGVVEDSGNLGSKKGCNLPGTNVGLPALSEKDKLDLAFGIEQGIDMVFASFIRNAKGVEQIREVLGEKGKNIWVIPKIENQQGMKNLTEIIAVSEGVMVARGDLGIEVPAEKVFIAQKKIIADCNMAGKPVICATQMLESMVKNRRPTRSEANDVANAVMDGADCVMLSGETAKGDFPDTCVRMMAKICTEAESCLWAERSFEDMIHATTKDHKVTDITTTSTLSAVLASYQCKAAAIVVLTTSGKSARQLTKYKPRCPIITVTRSEQLARQMQLFRGCIPLHYSTPQTGDWMQDVDDRIQFGINFGRQSKFISAGSNVVLVSGWRRGTGWSNTIRIITVVG